MTGCDTITLKRFKIPFGAVEMTQNLKAHTVLPEVPVLVLCTHNICKSRESASLFQPSRHYLQCCACVYSHTDTKHKDISFLPLLPPSLPFFLLSLPSHLSLPLKSWSTSLHIQTRTTKGPWEQWGIPAKAVGFPGSTLGGKEETMVLWPNLVTHPPMCRCGRIKQTIPSHKERHHLESKCTARNIREDWLC